MSDSREKRERKRFEPPPWEKDRLDPLSSEQEESEPERTDEKPTSGFGEAGSEAAPLDVADERRVQAMLLQLRRQEPSGAMQAWKVGAGSGAILTLLGLVLLVWGMVALAATGNAGAAGWFGALVLLTMGLLFAAVGVWLVVRSYGQRGVMK